jgi:ABC-type multidrug transport system fused ATPase/permease subunit
LTKSLFLRSLKVLERKDLNKLSFVVSIQICLSLLDLLGVGLIGILGALTVSGIQSESPSGSINTALTLLGINEYKFQIQASILGLSAAFVMILRTVLSIISTRRVLHFLSARGAQISSNLLRRLLSQQISLINQKTSQETLYALTNGVMSITLGIIGNSVTLIADLILLLVLFVGILAFDPVMAVSTLFSFSLISLTLYKLLHKKAQMLGLSQAKYIVQSNERIIEIVQGYREITVWNRKEFYASEISRLRFALSRDLAESSFLPYIGKYVLETAVVIGALGISATQFIISDAANAIATMSIFLAAGSRIAPAVLRMQHSGLQINSALGASGPTLNLIDELSKLEQISPALEQSLTFEYTGFTAAVEMSKVSYYYPSSESAALKNLSFEIKDGDFVAIVGSSGAGKSTLADLILGLLTPSSGEVLVSGMTPQEAIKAWPGSISYVPQDPLVINGSIKDNVAFGFPLENVSEIQIHKALEVAQMSEFVRTLPNGIETEVGERGARLSGGQRQRLGIARALYTNPRLIVLDEATSALDGKTESDFSHALSGLKQKLTLLVIAHRLSTVQDADKVIYLNGGQVQASGSFKEVRDFVKDFDIQAKLMGL